MSACQHASCLLEAEPNCYYCRGHEGGFSPGDRGRSAHTGRNWIQSFSGKKVTPLDLQPEQVDIESIAHALSMKCRFTGHTRCFYSVAEHCVLGAAYLPSAFQLPFLLHEVSEAYLPDVATPVKHDLWVGDGNGEAGALCTWETLERRQAAVVFKALGLEALEPLIYSPQVKTMDLRMLVTEREALIGKEIEPWGIDAKPVSIINALGLTPREAEERFLKAYRALTGAP